MSFITQQQCYISVSEVPTADFEDRLRIVGLSTEDVACTGASLLIDLGTEKMSI